MALRPAVSRRHLAQPPQHVTQPQRALVLLAAGLAVLTPVVQGLGVQFSGRAVLALLFCVLVPGAPAVALLRLRPTSLYLSLVFAVSLSTLLLLSTFLLAADSWYPILATLFMSLIGLGLTWPALRVHPREPLRTREKHDRRERWLGVGAVLLSLALWLLAVQSVKLDALGALGLVGVVGPTYWLGLLVLAVLAARHLRRAVPDPVVLGAIVVALTVELYGFLNAADTQASLPTGWLHVGFARYIADHGEIAHYYDARFSWPAFFAATDALRTTAGLKDAIPFLKPAPVVDVLLVLPGLWSLARTITGTPQLAWLSVLTFLSLDWYEQDYFSPQATVYVLYVAILATLLHLAPEPIELLGKQAAWRHPFSRIGASVPRPADAGPALAVGREGVLLIVCAGVVVSHQLTPVNLLVILLILVITGATRMRGLWLLVALIFLAWFTFGASEYWRSNIGAIFGDIGRLGSTVGSAVGGRLVGDRTHIRMQNIRLAWSAGSLLLGLFTVWRLRRTTWVWLLAGLALGPFGLLLVQSYGGEVALRSFLYAEPVLAPLMAMTVLWALAFLPERVRWKSLGLLLCVGFVVLTTTRGSNAAFERERTADINAAKFAFETPLNDRSPRTIGVVEYAAFAGLEHVTDWSLVSLTPLSCDGELDLEPCVRRKSPDLILMTSTMDEMGVLQDGQQPGWTDRLAASLARKKLYTKAFSQPGATVLRRVGPRP